MSPTVNAFFFAELELQSPEMVFRPSLSNNVRNSFYDLVDGLLNDVYKIGSLVNRVAGDGAYQMIMEENPELSDLRAEIMDRVKKVFKKIRLKFQKN